MTLLSNISQHFSPLLGNKNKSFRTCGFSLVELLIAVAIIGVIAAIAVPSYLTMVARSRRAEAFNQLASMYKAEKIFSNEFEGYSYCLWDIGFTPDAGTRRFYRVGFLNVTDPLNCPFGPCYSFAPGQLCDCTGGVAWGGTTRNSCTFNENFSANPAAWGVVGGIVWDINGKTFTVGAAGSISSLTPNLDVWTINHLKILTNTTSGIW